MWTPSHRIASQFLGPLVTRVFHPRITTSNPFFKASPKTLQTHNGIAESFFFFCYELVIVQASGSPMNCQASNVFLFNSFNAELKALSIG